MLTIKWRGCKKISIGCFPASDWSLVNEIIVFVDCCIRRYEELDRKGGTKLETLATSRVGRHVSLLLICARPDCAIER